MGAYCKVKFLDNAKDFIADNVNDNKPFNVIVENNKISYKERTKTVDGKEIVERTFFIDDIHSIEPYEREDIDDDII